MVWQAPKHQLLYLPKINNVAMMVSISDTNPDEFVYMQLFQGGVYKGIDIVLKNGVQIWLAPSVLPSFLTLIGCKSDDSKAYIALGVDVINDVVLQVVGVDESGGTSGGGNGDARIAGIVTIDGVPAARDVIVISDDSSGRKVVGAGTSDGTGAFDITYNDWDGAVIALALDSYGSAFVPSAPINLGAIVHPTVPNGYVYEVTGAGTTGTTEPTWAIDSSVISGSVTFNPRPYYRPVASGPLQGEIITPP